LLLETFAWLQARVQVLNRAEKFTWFSVTCPCTAKRVNAAPDLSSPGSALQWRAGLFVGRKSLSHGMLSGKKHKFPHMVIYKTISGL